MPAHLKSKNFSSYTLVLFLFVLISSELIVIANGAQAPLSPVIEVQPKRVSIAENVTLTLKIIVPEPSNVSASRPVISGAGEIELKSENASIILQPGQVGTLEWIYAATKSGSINFELTVTVKKISDQSTLLTQSLNSIEVGISTISEFFFIGVMILTLYVFLTSRYDWFKPKESICRLLGGIAGISSIILFFIFGFYFASLSYYIFGFNPELSIILLGVILFSFGYGCCISHKIIHQHRRIYTVTKYLGEPKVTELTGLCIVVFGLSGFFLNWQIWKGIFLIVTIGIMAIGKELIEMRTE